MKRVFGVLLALPFLLACDSIDAVKRKHGAAAQKTITAADSALADLRGRPELASAVAAHGYDRSEASKVVLDFGWRADGGNAAIVYDVDLRNHGELGEVYARIDGTRDLPNCAAMLEHSTLAWDPKNPSNWTKSLAGFEVERTLRRCGELAYLFVIRTLAVGSTESARVVVSGKEPPLGALASADAGTARDGGGAPNGGLTSDSLLAVGETPSPATCGKAGRTCTFLPAYVKAEVHLYALAPMKHLGVLPLVAQSASRVRYNSSIASSIELDLENEIETTLRGGLQTAGVTIKGAP